jgi:two-component system sensor histidine kinase DegS
MATNVANDESAIVEQFKIETQDALEKYNRELNDIELKIKQSDLEVSKLTNKNAMVTGTLQQLQGQFDQMTKSDVKNAYDNALDAQQRLFLMRGQLDKIQNDKVRLKEHVDLLTRVLDTFNVLFPEDSKLMSISTTAESIEMIIQAQESERQRLSRQMHDGPAQALSNFILQTEIAMRLFDIDQNRAKEELATLRNSATNSFQQVRDFIFDLRPMMLDDLGLVPTLKRYVDVYKTQPGASLELKVTGRERRLESYLEVMIFRAIQELLGNALRHSQASEVVIHLDMGDNHIRVSIDDNGKGFDTQVLENRGNMGIKVIKDRMEMLGGEFEIDSVLGQGTRVIFQVPAMDLSRLS